MGAVLEAADLNVWFEDSSLEMVHIVQGVDLSVRRGQRLGLVGESGCGKTTTLLALMGLLPESAQISGAVKLDGIDIAAGGDRTMLPHRATEIAMVFQGAMNSLNPVRTVTSQIVESLRFNRISRGGTARARARELLELVGIQASKGDSYPHEFSGGMRQRAAIAMALACDPKVLLADEPTTALDVVVQTQIADLLIDLCSELGMALILVSHDLPLVGQICDYIAVMYAGRVVESGPTGRLIEEPRHPYTQQLLAATPDLDSDVPPASIPGAPPPAGFEVPGCRFAERCSKSMTECATVAPPAIEIGDGRAVVCHLEQDA